MRLNRVQTAAVGIKILALDPHQVPVDVLPIVYGSSTVNLTAQVDSTISDLGVKIPVTISRATTVLTVTFDASNPHTLGGATDYVIISGTGNALLDGTFQLATVTNDTVITMTSPSSGTIAAAQAYATPVRFFRTVVASATPSATVPAIPTATLAAPFFTWVYSGLILNCTAWTAGTVYLDCRQAGKGA